MTRHIPVVILMALTLAAPHARGQAHAFGPAPIAEAFTDAQLEWFGERMHTLATIEPGPPYDDLAPLAELIGDARVVSLGECTHGSREIFRLKHRMLRYMVEELGFTVLTIEGSMAQALHVSKYISGTPGTAEKAINEMSFIAWYDHEIESIVKWMRDYNRQAERAGSAPVAFTGLDLTPPDNALEHLGAFVREHAPDLAGQLEEAEEAINAQRMPGFVRNTVASAELSAAPFAGALVRIEGAIRTRGLPLSGYAGIYLRADQGDKVMMVRNMDARGPAGDTDWTTYSYEVQVPEGIDRVFFGMNVRGEGAAWFDDVTITVNGKPYVDELMDLTFEAPLDPRFRLPPGHAPTMEIVDDEAHTGERSLRIAHVPPEGTEVLRTEARDAAGTLRRLARRLALRRARLVRDLEPHRVDWAIWCARLVEQTLRSGDYNAQDNPRDLAMADNLMWILSRFPEQRVVIWAHNQHVAKEETWLGKWLDERLGDAYLTIAITTAEGTYSAIGDDGERARLQPPPQGSIERCFELVDADLALIDLRGVADAAPWLAIERPYRAIGSHAIDQQFRTAPLAEHYDAFVFVRKTTAAARLGDVNPQPVGPRPEFRTADPAISSGR